MTVGFHMGPPSVRAFVMEAQQMERRIQSDIFGPLFVVFWFGAMAWIITSCSFKRNDVLHQLSKTPEYQCLAQAGKRRSYVTWSGIRHLRVGYGGATMAKIRDRNGGRSIPDGDAVTFITLPLTSGNERSLVRIPEGIVHEVYRGMDQWLDILNEDGSVHYRNDGEGYRPVQP